MSKLHLTDWDRRFIRLADEARTWTKGLGVGVDRGVGACVVSPNKRQLSLGYAGFPRGVEDTPGRLASKDYRDHATVHAEVNAILNAQCDLTEWTLYATSCPCSHCMAVAIQAGITRVVARPPDRTSSWHRSQLEGREMAREAGLMLVDYVQPDDPNLVERFMDKTGD